MDVQELENKKDYLRKRNNEIIQILSNVNELGQNSKNVISQYISDDIYGQSLDVLKLTDNPNDRILLTILASIFSSKLRTIPNNVRTQFLGKSAEIINQGVNDEVSLDTYIAIVINDVKINIYDLNKVSKIFQYAKPEALGNGKVQQFLVQLSQLCSNPDINSNIKDELKKQIARYTYFVASNGIDINIRKDMFLSECNPDFLPNIMISNHESLEYEKSQNEFCPKLEEFLEMLKRGDLPKDREKEFEQLVEQAIQNGIEDKNIRRILCNIITLNDITDSKNVYRTLLFSQIMMEKILEGPKSGDFKNYEELIADYISITPVGRVGNPFFPHSFFEAPLKLAEYIGPIEFKESDTYKNLIQKQNACKNKKNWEAYIRMESVDYLKHFQDNSLLVDLENDELMNSVKKDILVTEIIQEYLTNDNEDKLPQEYSDYISQYISNLDKNIGIDLCGNPGISSILQLVSHVKIDDVSKRKINQVLEEKFKVSQMDTIEINRSCQEFIEANKKVFVTDEAKLDEFFINLQKLKLANNNQLNNSYIDFVISQYMKPESLMTTPKYKGCVERNIESLTVNNQNTIIEKENAGFCMCIPFMAEGGLETSSKHRFILLNNNISTQEIYKILENIFHENTHFMQYAKMDSMELDDSILESIFKEKVIREANPKYYEYNYNMQYSEIQARERGATYLIEYLEKMANEYDVKGLEDIIAHCELTITEENQKYKVASKKRVDGQTVDVNDYFEGVVRDNPELIESFPGISTVLNKKTSQTKIIQNEAQNAPQSVGEVSEIQFEEAYNRVSQESKDLSMTDITRLVNREIEPIIQPSNSNGDGR